MTRPVSGAAQSEEGSRNARSTVLQGLASEMRLRDRCSVTHHCLLVWARGILPWRLEPAIRLTPSSPLMLACPERRHRCNALELLRSLPELEDHQQLVVFRVVVLGRARSLEIRTTLFISQFLRRVDKSVRTLRSSLSFCGSIPRKISIFRWSSTDMPGIGVLVDAVKGDCEGASPARGDEDEPAMLLAGA